MASIGQKIKKEDIVNAIESIVLRIEKLPESGDILKNFVPVIDFSAVSTPNTQIIYGRNGTGKTHLLKSYYQYCRSNFESNRIIPIYIDFQDLQFGPVLRTISLDDLILRFYRLFMYKIINTIKDFSDEIITVPLLEKIFGGKSQERKQKINDSIEILNSILNMEQVEERAKEYVRKVEIAREGSSKITGSLDISSHLSTSKAEAKIGADFGISAEEIEKEKEKIELIYGGLAIINYESIRRELENIIEQCGAEAIILLVDEWSSVNISIQPLLAEMIRKTLCVSYKIILKVVALKYFTRTSTIIDHPHRIGFQSGIDITQLADLDEITNFDINKSIVQDFLTIVLYKHICSTIPLLKEYNIKEFEDYICNEIFENPLIYHEVVRASEGNPRDFLNILQLLCPYLKQGNDKKIFSVQAISMAASYFNTTKAREIKNNLPAEGLYKRIFNKVIQNRQKLFLISVEKAESDPRIQEIWHYRFIHLINPNYMAVKEDGNIYEYSLYSMDYGRLLSLKVNATGEKIVDNMLSILDKASFLDRILPFRAISLASTIINLPIIGETIKKAAGTYIVSREGVETADTSDVNYLIENCVVDSIL